MWLWEDEEVWLGHRFDENKKSGILTKTHLNRQPPPDPARLLRRCESAEGMEAYHGRAGKEWEANIGGVVIFCK